MTYPAAVLRSVAKPIRYVGGEFNAIRKDPRAVRSRVALVFPDTYEIGMSHLGSRLLYHRLNSDPTVAAERVFCPWPDLEEQLQALGLPLRSLENGLPLADFHLVGISLLYELCFTNVLTVLERGGIPRRSADRSLDTPLVVGGGPVGSNPEPVADFFDLILLGEGEEAFPEIVALEAELRSGRGRPATRSELLRRFTAIPGVYVPSLYPLAEPAPLLAVDPSAARAAGLPGRVRRRWRADLDGQPLPADLVVPNTDIVHDRVTAEISRGCLQGCRFCHAGIFYRPQRERGAAGLVRWIRQAVDRTGHEEVSLASLSTADFGGIEDLAEGLGRLLQPARVALSLPSLRVSGLRTRLAEAVAEVRRTGFTIAPEAGTQRMRDRINKKLSEAEILEAVLTAYRSGWDLIKLYFMIGLPGETDEDISGIAALVERILAAVRGELQPAGPRRPFSLNLGLASFVPKPHTPFQWARMDSMADLERKRTLLLGRLRRLRQVTLKWSSPAVSRLEGVFSRGDRRLGRVIERAWEPGARFDGWHECFRPELWQDAFHREGIDPDIFLQGYPPGTPLPWSHLDLGVGEAYLRGEWEAAEAGRLTPACGVVPGRAEAPGDLAARCARCGNDCNVAGLLERRRRNLAELARLLEAGPDAPEAPGEPPCRYRLTFTKLETSAWMSHLDLIRTVQRIFRRSGLPLAFSGGFHPHPRLSFAPALAVGIGSRGEMVDVWLTAPIHDMKEGLAVLNRASPAGIRFLKLEPLPEQAPPLERWVNLATYRLRMPTVSPAGDDPAASPGGGDFNRRCTEILARSAVTVLRRKRGQADREFDLRPLLLELRSEAGPGRVDILYTVRVGSRGAVRPEDILGLLRPGYDGEYTAERLSLAHTEVEPSPSG